MVKERLSCRLSKSNTIEYILENKQSINKKMGWPKQDKLSLKTTWQKTIYQKVLWKILNNAFQ